MISGVPNAKNERLRARVFDRDQNLCRYCGILTQKEGRYQRTIDHHIPRVLGGPNSVENCVTCCSACNTEKGEDDPRDKNTIWKLIPLPELPMSRMVQISDNERMILVAWARKNKRITSIKTVIDAEARKSYLRVIEENFMALAELARIRRSNMR